VLQEAAYYEAQQKEESMYLGIIQTVREFTSVASHVLLINTAPRRQTVADGWRVKELINGIVTAR
jgi:hypothetical protein